MISVMVSVSRPRLEALQLANQPVPSAVTGKFLIDTGASGTAIDRDLIAGLQLPLIGQVHISTPSTASGAQHVCDQYDVGLYIPPGTPGTLGFVVPAMPIITTDLKHQGIDGLLGRDVLNRCTLVYLGSAQAYSLNY